MTEAVTIGNDELAWRADHNWTPGPVGGAAGALVLCTRGPTLGRVIGSTSMVMFRLSSCGAGLR